VNYGNKASPTKGQIPVIPQPNPNKDAPIKRTFVTLCVYGY